MATKRKKATCIPHMKDEELRKFVDDLVSGRVFTSAQVSQPNITHLIFMPLIFGISEFYTKRALSQVGVIWEYYSEAWPSGVNGYPIFGSCRFMHKDDWDLAKNAALIEQERRKHIELPK